MTDELNEILSDHESLCENQTEACGDCRRLKQAIQAIINRSVAEARKTTLQEVLSYAYQLHENVEYPKKLETHFEAEVNNLATLTEQAEK